MFSIFVRRSREHQWDSCQKLTQAWRRQVEVQKPPFSFQLFHWITFIQKKGWYKRLLLHAFLESLFFFIFAVWVNDGFMPRQMISQVIAFSGSDIEFVLIVALGLFYIWTTQLNKQLLDDVRFNKPCNFNWTYMLQKPSFFLDLYNNKNNSSFHLLANQFHLLTCINQFSLSFSLSRCYANEDI